MTDAMDSQIQKTIEHLVKTFNYGSRHLRGNAVKGTKLYELQVEFAYMLNNISQSSAYIVPKLVSLAYEFINSHVVNSKP